MLVTRWLRTVTAWALGRVVDPSWTKQIEVLAKPEPTCPIVPLDLPAVKPLKGEFVNPPKSKVSPFPSRFM